MILNYGNPVWKPNPQTIYYLDSGNDVGVLDEERTSYLST
ncbi:hypothetical protein CP10139811_0330 [Chlamydia ibidis]|uniref:Uncharacterized protein n=1 Tax=Chlamydia ibidis TaxID=1405396 RepID=S7KIV8_9CHLA|nr:hypothetical protein CP10139811_0330 [Chlamydia ibidis]